jgi:L-ascorbate metabolism protein UlaG (beta-lactamase superfamily)
MSEKLGITITFVGGPTAVLEIGGVRLLTDPTFSAAGKHESVPGRALTKTEHPGLAAEDIGPIDAVLLSHDQHADNLDPAGRAFLDTVPRTLTTPSGADRLGGAACGLARWERTEVGPLVITAVPARHGPEGAEPVTGEVTGFLVGGEDLPTVYVSGDNASLGLVREIADRADAIDLAVLFAGGARTPLLDGEPLTLTSEDAAVAARILDAGKVVGLHVRGWTHFTEGPEFLREAFNNAGLADRLHLPDPGATLAL